MVIFNGYVKLPEGSCKETISVHFHRPEMLRMDPSWNDKNGVVLVVLIRGRPCQNSAVIEGPGHISRRSGEMPGVGTCRNQVTKMW